MRTPYPFRELPEKGASVRQFSSLGVVESVKAASDIYAPVSGEIVERNMKVIEKPELVNTEPYGDGWMIRVRMGTPGEVDSLLTAAEYEDFTKAESK